VPKGRLFALSRDELLEALALMRAVGDAGSTACRSPRRRWISLLSKSWPRSLATIGTKTSCSTWSAGLSVSHLSRDDYESILDMVSEGMAPERGGSAAYVQRDRSSAGCTPQGGTADGDHLRRGDPGDHQLQGRPRRRNAHGGRQPWTRTSRSNVTPAMSSCWAIRRGGPSMSAAARSSSRARRGRRRPCRSGSAKRQGGQVELSAEVGRLREKLAARISLARGE